MPDSAKAPAKGRIAHATRESAPPVEGRRDFFRYRDLGVMEASGGALRAQTMTGSIRLCAERLGRSGI